MDSASDQPITRIDAAKMLVQAMGWTRLQNGRHYADLADGPDSVAADILFEHWIDSRLWDSWPSYAPDGRLMFRPAEPLNRGQLAELVYLAHLYAGPLWEDFSADRTVRRDPPTVESGRTSNSPNERGWD
jgi:hypothetical protein